MASTQDDPDKPKSKRLFINHVDQYQGKNLAKFENKDQLYEHLVECDVIVYDITEDPDQIDEAVMTPEIPFTEDDYRRRKPHPNFKEHISAEKTVIKLGKTQADFDQLLVNLRMDAVFVKENMRIPWVSEAGLVENILKVIKEYKDSRNLQPLRAVILGPPAVGKTPSFSSCVKFTSFTMSRSRMSLMKSWKTYKPRRVVLTLKTKTKRTMGQAQEAQEILDQINESKEQNGGRMEDQFVIRFFRNRLKSMPCQNQGFILDGYPKTLEQAKDLFALDDEEEAEEGKPSFDQTIMPEFVISLEATDEFLRSRVMHLPEAMVAGTHNTEKELMRRLADYRVINTEEETVLNYFDELEFHPERIDVTTDTSPNMKDTVEKIKKIMKSPRNYGPTPEELAEMQRQEEETRQKKEAEEKAERERREAEEATERKRKQEEWSQRLNEVKREEYELLEAQSVPLRNYLMQHVMPTMTQALIDCCKSRPDDPIDYIAEYLFQHNPQVD
nr:hypothetical protein BaRGS_008466 [Batillaria attramentaria]